jgi:hypothetical protein
VIAYPTSFEDALAMLEELGRERDALREELARFRSELREIQGIASPGRAWPYDRVTALLGGE